MVYIAAAADGRESRICDFGFSPTWSDSRRVFSKRSKEYFEKPIWRAVILRQRRLVPAPGHFEYQETGQKRKQHWHVWPKSKDLMGLAGAFNDWEDVSLPTIESNAVQSANTRSRLHSEALTPTAKAFTSYLVNKALVCHVLPQWNRNSVRLGTEGRGRRGAATLIFKTFLGVDAGWRG